MEQTGEAPVSAWSEYGRGVSLTVMGGVMKHMFLETDRRRFALAGTLGLGQAPVPVPSAPATTVVEPPAPLLPTNDHCRSE